MVCNNLASANHGQYSDSIFEEPGVVNKVVDKIKESFTDIDLTEKINQDPGSHLPTKIEDIYMDLGNFSWFQAWATFVMVLPEIPGAMLAVLPVFAGTTNVPFTCETYDNSSNQTLLTTKIIYGNNAKLCSSNCTSIKGYGDSFNSVVQEWNLVCEHAWITDTFTSIQMIGMMSGAFLGSQISDKWGRKLAFYGMILLMGIFGIGSGLSIDPYSYGITRFLCGIGIGGFYCIYNIYLIEFLTPSYRTISGCLSIWFLGELILVLLAYNINSWRYLTYATCVPIILVFCTYPFMPESPRWLFCKNRTLEGKKVLNQIAKFNFKSPPSEDRVVKLQEAILNEEFEEKEETERTESLSSKSPLRILFESNLRLKTCLFLFGWFSCAFVYYGVTFNAKNLSGDRYLNILYMALVDMPAFPSGMLFNNWLGRKKSFSLALGLGGFCLIALVIVEEIYGMESALITPLCLTGRFWVSSAWGIVSCFTAESFPTIVRSSSLGLCSLAANVGGVVAPQLAFLYLFWPALPYFIFCGVTVLAALSSWFLDETNGVPLQNFNTNSTNINSKDEQKIIKTFI